MSDVRVNVVAEDKGREADWARSERRSIWIAAMIALAPIPVAVAISWALGAPPWRSKPAAPAAQHDIDHAHGGMFPHR